MTFFFPNLNWSFHFAVSTLFHDLALFFVYFCCWNNEYILDNISRIWDQKVSKKLTLTFLLTHFQLTRVPWTYFVIYGAFDLFIKMLNLNDRLEIWWHHQNSRDFDYYFDVFEKFYVVPHSCKVWLLGFNLFRIYDGKRGGNWPSPSSLISKKPRLVRIKTSFITKKETNEWNRLKQERAIKESY